MELIVEPIEEQEVLAVTSEDATPELVRDDIEAKAQCCVDHLCGCK